MKRIICVLLAAIFALTVFVSCSPGNDGGNENDNNKNESVTDTDNPTEAESETVDSAYIENLPDMDFGGKTFTFLSYGNGEKDNWTTYDIVRETETGDPINDAVYIRNRRIEARFGITIKAQYNGSASLVEKTVNSGDNAFHIVNCGNYLSR